MPHEPKKYPDQWPLEVTQDVQRHMNDIGDQLREEFPENDYAMVLIVWPANMLPGTNGLFGRFSNLEAVGDQIITLRAAANALEAAGMTPQLEPMQPRPAPKGKLPGDGESA